MITSFRPDKKFSSPKHKRNLNEELGLEVDEPSIEAKAMEIDDEVVIG